MTKNVTGANVLSQKPCVGKYTVASRDMAPVKSLTQGLSGLGGGGFLRSFLREQEVERVSMSLANLLNDFIPGTYPQPWTWDDEERDILARLCLCCASPGHYQVALEAHLRVHGLTEGIWLEEDGCVRESGWATARFRETRSHDRRRLRMLRL